MDVKSSQCFDHVYIAESFYQCKDKNYDLINGFRKCNLVFLLKGFDILDLRNKVVTCTSHSGVGANLQFLDFYSLENVLAELRNKQLTSHIYSCSPAVEIIHEKLTADVDNYLNEEYQLQLHPPIRKLTEIIHPRGIIEISDNASLKRVTGMDLYQSTILNKGFTDPNSGFVLKLPADRVFGKSSISPINKSVQLFLVIGPSDEILVECDSSNSYIAKNEASESTIESTDGKYFQEYTSVFVFANSRATAENVMEQVASKCKKYTKVISLTSNLFREIAAIKLGDVPCYGNETVLSDFDDFGKMSSLSIKHMKLSISPRWFYSQFMYSDNFDGTIFNHAVTFEHALENEPANNCDNAEDLLAFPDSNNDLEQTTASGHNDISEDRESVHGIEGQNIQTDKNVTFPTDTSEDEDPIEPSNMHSHITLDSTKPYSSPEILNVHTDDLSFPDTPPDLSGMPHRSRKAVVLQQSKSENNSLLLPQLDKLSQSKKTKKVMKYSEGNERKKPKK